MSSQAPPPDEWPRPRTDAGARVLVERVDKLRDDLKDLTDEVRELTDLLKEIKRDVGLVQVKIEVHEERHQHNVTWGRLMGVLAATAVSIVSVCWNLTEKAKIYSEEQARRAISETTMRTAAAEGTAQLALNRVTAFEMKRSGHK